MSKQLKVLINAVTLETSGGEITLKPFKFKDFDKALGLIEPYLKTLSGVSTAAEVVEGLLAKSGDSYQVLTDLIALLTMVSGQPSDFFDDCGYDEVISLITEVVEMNLDFFFRLGTQLNNPKEEEEVKTGELKSVA